VSRSKRLMGSHGPGSWWPPSPIGEVGLRSGGVTMAALSSLPGRIWILPESGRVRSTCFPLPIGLVGGVISEARVGRD
jgi:hypothetical protein